MVSWTACAQDNKRQLDKLSSSLQTDSQGLLSDAKGAIEEVIVHFFHSLISCFHVMGCSRSQVRRELKVQAAAAGRLGTIESRLSSLEGSILSAGEKRSRP